MKIAPHKIAKAQAFWKLKAERRKSPLYCARCCRPHDRAASGSAQCPACLAYAAEYRLLKRRPVEQLKAYHTVEARLSALEHTIARMQLAERVQYRKGYNAGQRARKHYSDRASYFAAMPEASAQDLAEMSHAYSAAR